MILLIIYLIFTPFTFADPESENQFIFNGFKRSNLELQGLAEISPNGFLQLTNTTKFQKGHAFYKTPLKFDKKDLSFSTSFVFAIYPEPDIPHSGHGIAFVISPSMDFTQALPAEYLGLFNYSNNGLPTNHVFSVELDTVQNAAFDDIDGNHVGIDVNSLTSVNSSSAVYYSGFESDNKGKILTLTSGEPMQVWIDYDDEEMLVSVKLGPIRQPKPNKNLISARVNLSDVLLGSMYVGFSSSTGISTNKHYILGWSWNQSGKAQSLDPSRLPSLPPRPSRMELNPILLAFLIIATVILVGIGIGVVYIVRRKKYEEIHEVWEHEYAPYRIPYKDLYRATKGFKEKEVLGFGGFGKVYKGTLQDDCNTQVAVKRVSHDSKQGLREFVAEIASMRRLRHRNLVQLLGYCRRETEFLLVYDYMPNGSLDKFLFNNQNLKPIIGWNQRVKIIKGVASALLYLHEEWEQVVLHRDVKASNVLLDANMDARLGDFGLARLYDHETGPQTTRVVGTIGYLAPELSRTGKPTTKTDVFAFGTFMLEVGCGRRPIGSNSIEEECLVDWVFEFWKKGEILETCDSRLEGKYDAREMESVLKMGLMCCHVNPEKRPNMRQVVQFLEGSVSVNMVDTNDLQVETYAITSNFINISLPSMPFYISSPNDFASAGSMSSDDSILLGR